MGLDEHLEAIDDLIDFYNRYGIEDQKNLFEEILNDLIVLRTLKENLYFYIDREGQENVRAIFKLTEPVDVRKYKIIKEFLENE